MDSTGGIEKWAIGAFDPHGDDASAGGKCDTTDGRAPRRIRDRPICAADVGNFASREHDKCTASAEPQMRCPQACQAAFCSSWPFERVNEEAEIAQLGNARE